MPDIEALLLSPHGRIGRQTYWTLVGLIVAAWLFLSSVPFFGALASVPLLWPFGCVVAQRLHDRGRCGWWVPPIVALHGVAAMLSFAVTLIASDPAHVVAAFGWALPLMMLNGINMIAALTLILFAGLRRGTPGTNRFGPPERMPLTPSALVPHERE